MSPAPLTPHMQLNDWEHVPRGMRTGKKNILKEIEGKNRMKIILKMSCNQKEKTEIRVPISNA
jgi:hypothetical protein